MKRARESRTGPRTGQSVCGLFLVFALLLQACTQQEEPRPPVHARDVIATVQAAAADRPNIIIIMADDLGYGDLGSYGSRAIRTPHIDSLADEGIRFTDFHASDSVCTPSRAGLLTGRYAKRMGLDFPLQSEDVPFWTGVVNQLGFLSGKLGLMDMASEGGASGLYAYEITLAEALKVGGYATGMVGKWHLGDFATNPEYNPLRHGFDFYFGVPHSNDMRPFPLYRGEEQVLPHVEDQTILTGRYTEEAIRFIESSKQDPFFLYFAHTFPHRPLYASEAFRDRSEGGIFGDTVEEIDWSVGELLAVLDRHGLRDNTLIVFTSDNGPWYQGSPGGLRGRKGQGFEGGHRVPFVARWPRAIPAGIVSREPAMNIDLFPTCLALGGLSLPADRIIDGKSMVSLLTRLGSPSPHERMFFYHQGELEGVREGKWKYFRSINHYVWPMPVNKKRGGLSEHTTGPLPLLFNLEIDPDESYDLSRRHPEMARKLAEEMTRWEEGIRTNRPGEKR